MELQREKEAEKLERQLALPPSEHAATQESVFREMCEGLLEESDGEDEREAGCAERPEADDGASETSPTGAAGPEKRMEKKTEQQRRREKAARKLVSHTGPSVRGGDKANSYRVPSKERSWLCGALGEEGPGQSGPRLSSYSLSTAAAAGCTEGSPASAPRTLQAAWDQGPGGPEVGGAGTPEGAAAHATTGRG